MKNFHQGIATKLRELQVLMVLQDEESGKPTKMGEQEVNEMSEGNSLVMIGGDAGLENVRLKKVGLSLKSMVGLTSPKTMKLQGEIGSQQVVVLIDNGATHNFISSDLVRKLTIPMEEIRTYGI